jgi:uncharacterized protein with NRDE domain
MCLILVAWQAHPRFPLVVAANRDEWFARPAEAARFWPEAPDLLAGRDASAGGTWLGLTRRGRFAALTNYRGGTIRPDALSRGQLVRSYLTDGRSAQAWAAELDTSKLSDYNGFNLLFGDMKSLHCHSNAGGGSRPLPPGIYGLSNEYLDTPWPKVRQSKSALAAALAALPDDDALFRLLRDDRTYPDHQLPETGVTPEWERLLSAAFVRGPDYGTRCSTVILVDADGLATFDEQIWLPGARAGLRSRFRLRLEL